VDRGPDRFLRWFLPTLGGLLFLLAYAFTLFIRGGSLFGGDGDPGRHIRLGRYILDHRAIPRIDLFSHTMQGERFIPFEWLSEVIFAAADAWRGLTGVAILTAFLFAGAVWLTYTATRRSGVPAFMAVGFGFLALLLQAIHIHPRPHMFTTAFTALFSLILLEVRRGASRRWLLALPVLMVLWVNLHGGFLVGFIVLAAFGAEALLNLWRDPGSAAARELTVWLLGALVACFVASFANPAGWELWPHTTGYLRETYLVDFTQEYKSPDFHDTLIKSFLITLLLGTTVLALLRSRVEPLGLGLWLVFAAFALHSTRNIPLFAVVCTPWLAGWSMALVRQEEPSRRPIRRFADWTRRLDRTAARLPGWPIAILGWLLLTKVSLDHGSEGAYAFDPEVFPVAAVEELKAIGFVPPGPVYNEFIWGGYLLYAWPEVRVFIDGQTDFYGEALTREYRDIRFIQPHWEERLRDRGIAWVIVPPDAPLAAALPLLGEWEEVYSDDTATVLIAARERK
jgi:hypothetical protein